MKNFFLILVLVLGVCTANAIQPLRKPSILIKVNGKSLRNGDLLTVTPGQKFTVEVEMEGGRRDYCNFPDTYADIVGKAQILSRGKDGISYMLNEQKFEWKLLSETTRFSTENALQLNVLPNKKSAEVTVTTEKFSQTYLKISTTAKWQFNQNGTLSEETNLAEGTIYVQLAGSSDIWFKTQNIEATGIRNDLVQEKLNLVQAACDSVEKNFYRLDFAAAQQSIRDLQGSVNTLKATIDEVKAANEAYQTNIIFIGLPSDQPYKDIDVIAAIKASWIALEPLLDNLKQQLGKLPEQSTPQNKDELIKIINQYLDWQYKLPEKTFTLLPVVVPEMDKDSIRIPANIHFTAEEKSVADYSQTIVHLNAFFDQRIQQVPDEIQKINSIHARLQAIRLFDQMLRSYFSSIMWAQWKSTRGF